MIADDVISRCRVHLKDTAGALRWPDSELWLWLQDGVDLIGDNFPAEASQFEVITLVGGSRQVVPEHWRTLVRLERNVGGREIRRVVRYAANVMALLGKQEGEVKEYWQDDVSNTEYWVWPIPPAGSEVEAYGSIRQPVIGGGADKLVVPDGYRSALVDFVMSAALSKDVEYADNVALAGTWAQSFTQKTGIKLQGKRVNPLPVTEKEAD